EWNDLVSLASITGPAGNDGTDGDDGADGREVQFQASATHIQWRYEGESEWTDLIALTSITGPAGADGEDGDPGADGREVELQKGDTSIQWRYVGDAEWNDLVALSEITGPAGDPGSDGLSAYQVWLGLGNAGTEQDFIDALKGEQGDPGDGVESVVRLPIIHLTSLDLSEPHPLGGYLEPNRTMFQLLGQDDPDENGTYATPDDPSTEGIVKVPVGEQILDPSNQYENISKPFVATMMIAGANWWIGAHEFFVG